LFSNLHTWEEDHEFKIRWNFFATSHGKGPVDGLGGSVKRSVWRQVKSGMSHVENAKDYATVAKERNPHIHIEYISQVKINDMKSTLDAKWLDVCTVPGTHQLHCVIPNGPDKLLIADTSDADSFKVVLIRKVEDNNDDAHRDNGGEEECDNDDDCEDETETLPATRAPPLQLTTGQWVVVDYDGDCFPGEVTQCGNDDVEVNVMHKSGQFWKWPSSADKIFYSMENVKKVIQPPKVAGSRGQFMFDYPISSCY